MLSHRRGHGGRRITAANRSDEEIRDNYVSRLVNGKWTTPQPVFNDNWKIAACPVNGPALAANVTDVAMTWFTVKQDQGQPISRSPMTPGRTVGEPDPRRRWRSLGRVDVELLPDGAALATWIEFADQPKPQGAGERKFRPAASTATAPGRHR